MSIQNDNESEQPARESMPREFFEALYDSVAQELRNINTSFQGAAAATATNYGPYHQAAAVLSAFEIGKIRPATSSREAEKIEELLADSTVVYDDPNPLSDRRSGESQIKATDSKETTESLGARSARWTLLPAIRRRVIEQMGTREAFLQALGANPERSDDPMQRMLERYLRGEKPPPRSQSVEELACTAQVVEWFHGQLDNLPDPQEIARQLDEKRQRQPFEKLVGQHFSGREEQLRKLREYVGVLEPTSVWSRVKRKTESFLNWREKPPLMIYGPGGVGKSTLVAKFILDHTTNLNAIQRFPYAYLDFDRPGLLAEEPATLLVEAVRQLGIQYPDVREHSERVRKVWEEELSVVARQAQSLGSEAAPLGSAKLSKQQRTTLLKDFDSLLNAMGLSDEPFLLVLDTFEEVQYRSHQYIQQLWEALEELQSILPRLRTVFSGRALLKDFKTDGVALNDLDAAAAKGFLTASKIQPESLIDTIVKRIGGNPLSLRLAVQIFHNEGGASQEFFDRLQKGRIQSALYTRVLEHIHDKNVMKLAHPGLILRRITPGLILKVLAKPCRVEVNDLAEAEKLFDSLSREITLVVPGGTTKDEPRALRHMTEVRRGMIQLLREDEEQKDKVLEIQRNAIAYYEPFDDPVSRAEEIYHRLTLKDDHNVIAERWITGVRDNLFNAIEELEPKEQGFLAARLDIDIDDDILAQANQPDWEVIVSRRVNNFLRLGQHDRALESLATREEYLPGSVLYVLEAQAYQEMGSLEEAAAVIARGLASDPESTWVRFRLMMMAGRIHLRMGRVQEAFQNLVGGRSLAWQLDAPMLKVEATLGLLSPELADVVGAETQATLEKELLELLETIPDETLSEQLGLVRYAVGRFAERDDDLVIRAVRLVGFESANQKQLRSLGGAIAEWDLSVSSEANVDPGLLARKAKIPLLSEISETWKQFAQTFPPTVVKDVVTLLLSNYAMTPKVRAALIAILRVPSRDEVASESPDAEDVLLGSGNTRVGTGVPVTPIPLRLTTDERQSVAYALMSAFPTRSSLERMLFYRLNINLNSISLTDDLNRTVDMLVHYAETREFMVHLIAVARESNPGNLHLANIARKFGLSPDSKIEELSEADTASGIADIGQWRVALSEMSGRVCRVELSADVVRANGFLVGANVLVTTYAALEPVINGNLPAQNVAFRFDYKIYNDTAVNPGTVYRLSKDDWLILANPGDLNFAMVRLEGLPGREPVGGERAEPGASPRGWIYVEPVKAKNLAAAGQMMLLHYSSHDSLKLVLDSSGFTLNEERTRLNYHLNENLLPGAPCFNGNWELAGLHTGMDPDASGESYGTSVAAVVNELERNGFDLVGRDKFEATVLRGDRVFLNRAELRKALREMAGSAGRRILVVNGPHGSGKTYTREYVLDVAYNTPNHRVIYVDLDTADFSPTQLVELIGEQMNLDVRSLPMLETEQQSRWIRRVVDYLIGQIRSNTTIKWWLIFDGFSKPLNPSTNDLIMELADRVRSVELRLILLNYTLPLPAAVSSGVIREEIKPIGREDVEAFLAQRIQNDPGTSSQTIKTIVDQVLAVADEAAARDNYPTANYLRVLNRAINRILPGDQS